MAAAIVGLQVCIGVAAHAIGVGHALGVENVADFVGLVAVEAGGQYICLFLPEFAPDRLAVHHFDFGMAFGAGGRDVAPVDRRIRIGVRQDVVRGVARHAGGGDDQAFLENRLAVDALRIIFENVVLVDVAVQLDGRAFAMATAADERNIQRGNGGAFVLNREDVVIAVAVHAMRGERVAAGNGLAVQGGGVLLLFVAVAGAALDRSDAGVMGQVLAVERGVAGSAGEDAVNRSAKFLGVDKQGDGPTAVLDGHGLVAVAGEAVVVGGTGGADAGRPEGEKQQRRPRERCGPSAWPC